VNEALIKYRFTWLLGLTLFGVIVAPGPGLVGGRLVGQFKAKVLGNGDLRPAEIVGGFLAGAVVAVAVLMMDILTVVP
jgi:hypothetical protein